MRKREEDAPLEEIPTPLQGFEALYHLLRSLTAGQDTSSFYERLQMLLLLSRWEGKPPTMREMAQGLTLPLEQLSYHLQRLRASGWLTNEERSYCLTVQGRLLLFVLRLLAQPWQEKDSVSVITQLYAAASSQELGLGSEHLFEDVVAAIEVSLRRLRQAVSAERTSLVSQYHEESDRNVRMADMALELRKQGIADHDYALVERMHHALSALSVLSSQLEQQRLTLLERDLLSSGQVTLGDIQQWVAQADDFVCATMIGPHVEQLLLQPWLISEGKLIAADIDISGRTRTLTYRKTPMPQPFRPPDAQVVLYPHQRYLAELQGQLRQMVFNSSDGLALATWVQQKQWSDALARLMVTLDPLLSTGTEPIHLRIHPQGHLLMLEAGAVQQVSDATLNKEVSTDVL